MDTQKQRDRISFFLNRDLSSRIYELSKQTKRSLSDIARDALSLYLQEIEKARINEELKEGYTANYEYYLKQQEEWKFADHGDGT